MWDSCREHRALFWGLHRETGYHSRLRSQRCKVSHTHTSIPALQTHATQSAEQPLSGLCALVRHSDRVYALSLRFLQYWGRIGSENNMTSCHRPVCRKEGVLLDYSKDGGLFQSACPRSTLRPSGTSLPSFAGGHSHEDLNCKAACPARVARPIQGLLLGKSCPSTRG